MSLFDLTALELGAKIQAGEVSAVDAARACLARIEEKEPTVHAFVTVTPEAALARAEAVQKRIDSGELTHPLAGVPMAVKDLISTKGVRTTCASKMLENYVPVCDATVVQKLDAIGAVCLGKTNMDEFAMGSSTENSAMKPVHNPRSLDRVPGGSSGGSAAAVAAREAAFTLGSDTGGSIRQPAAFCGVVGMKPTYGAVSRYGLIAFASSLDQIGPFTADVESNAIVLSAIVGHDGRDATSLPHEYPDFTDGIGGGVSGMKVALPGEFLADGISPEVKTGVLKAADALRAQGAQIEEVSMPVLKYALPAYYVISSAEASSNLSRFDGVKYGYRTKDFETLDELYTRSRTEGFGAEVKRRIMLGSFALSSGYYDAYYKKALQVRTLISRAYDDVFAKYDLILSPVAPTTAYKAGAKGSSLEMYMGDIYTVPVNIAGLPALSMPCARDGEGLPVGVQLIGPHFAEQKIYRAGLALEQAVGTYDEIAAQGGDR